MISLTSDKQEAIDNGTHEKNKQVKKVKRKKRKFQKKQKEKHEIEEESVKNSKRIALETFDLISGIFEDQSKPISDIPNVKVISEIKTPKRLTNSRTCTVILSRISPKTHTRHVKLN